MHRVIKWERSDDIYATVEFRVKAKASSVYVIGSFTSWHPGTAPLSRIGEDEWVGEFRIREGNHYYAFMLNARDKFLGDCSDTVKIDTFGDACRLQLISDVEAFSGSSWRFRDPGAGLERVRTRSMEPEGYLDLGEVDGLRWWERESSDVEGGCDLEPPQWVLDSIIYQVFPSSFMRDFKDLGDKLSHVADVADAVYLNPVWESPSYHGYDVTNYFKVKEEYGGNAGLLEFMDRAHSMGIRVILDGVFNHVSSMHPLFQDVVERGVKSPFHDWFIINGDRADPSQFNYEAFLSVRKMPRLNYGNEGVRRLVKDVGEYWVRAGADGWRLDVAHGVPPSFWREFTEAITSARRDAYVLGEVWGEPDPWVCSMHGVTDFAVYRFINNAVRGSINEREVRRLQLLPRGFLYASWNFIDNHDTPRLLTVAQGNPKPVRLGLALVFTLPGVPMIYYGDEVGLPGGPDPDNRRQMIWDPGEWDLETLSLIKRLREARRELPELRRGAWSIEVASGVVRVKRWGRRLVELVGNFSGRQMAVDAVGTDLITGGDISKIELEPYGFALVVS